MLAGMAGLNGLVLPETLGARLGGAGEILISMGWRFEEMFFFLGTPQILWLAGLLAFVWIMPNTLEWTGYREDGSPAECRGLLAWSTNTLWALALSGLMIVCLVFMSRTGEFLYFQF